MSNNLSPEILASFKSALTKLTGYTRRQYAAELCESFFDNSPRKMERKLNVSRTMIQLGLAEKTSGIRCIDSYHLRGAKKKNQFTKI